MSVFIGYPSFMAYQMMKGKKGNNDGFPSIPGMIARYSAKGLTNEEMSTNPVWKDLMGNGYDLQMKNFAWKEGSGISDVYPGFILGDGVDDFAVTEKELNFEDTYTVYTAFVPFQDDPARNMILCGKNDTKDFNINYSGTHLNFKPSTGVNLAVRIDQFALLVCKRNKDITTIINYLQVNQDHLNRSNLYLIPDYITCGEMCLPLSMLKQPLLVKQSVMDIFLQMKTMKRFLIGIKSNILGYSLIKRGQ